MEVHISMPVVVQVIMQIRVNLMALRLSLRFLLMINTCSSCWTFDDACIGEHLRLSLACLTLIPRYWKEHHGQTQVLVLYAGFHVWYLMIKIGFRYRLCIPILKYTAQKVLTLFLTSKHSCIFQCIEDQHEWLCTPIPRSTRDGQN